MEQSAPEKPNPQEIAAARDSDEFYTAYAGGIREAADPVLKGRGAARDLRAFDQVRADSQVQSTLQQRRDAVVALPLDVLPGDDRPASEEAAEELRDQLKQIAFDSVCRKMLWGVFYGYAVGEVMWDTSNAKVEFAEIKVRRARRFGFDADGALMLRKTTRQPEMIMPERKFWVMSTGADTTDEPYGFPLASLLYWPAYFKRHGMKAWMIALNKFATPTAVGKYPTGTVKGDQDKLLSAVQAIENSSSIAIPDGMLIELLQTAKSAGMDFNKFMDYLDSVIAKDVLSQTMTTDNGSSKSQSTVHLEVRDEVAGADAALLCDTFNEGPVTWWTEWNYGDRAAPPLIRREKEETEDADEAASRDEKLSRMGWFPTPERIARVYGDGYVYKEPKPQPSEPNRQDVQPDDDPTPPGLSDGPKPDAITTFVDKIMADGTPQSVVSDMLAPLVQSLADAQSFDDVAAALDAADPDLSDVGEELAKAMFASRLGGEVGAQVRDGQLVEEV